MEPEPPTGEGRRFGRHAFVCTSPSSCGEAGEAVQATMKELLRASGLKERLRVNKAGCLGQCGHGPLVVVYPEGVWYSHVTPEGARRIWDEHMLEGRVVEELRYRTEKPGTNVVPKRPDQSVDTASPWWSPCGRCPPA